MKGVYLDVKKDDNSAKKLDQKLDTKMALSSVETLGLSMGPMLALKTVTYSDKMLGLWKGTMLDISKESKTGSRLVCWKEVLKEPWKDMNSELKLV